MRITTESNGGYHKNPLLKDSEGKLVSFDIIVANPPFHLRTGVELLKQIHLEDLTMAFQKIW